jgi:AcrR family transcriptional regulator
VTQARVAPKRSLLVQDRSRATRRRLIRAALELWDERGYETAIEETTADEIAARAGFSKATFYLHFARKEDVLFEAGWLTAEVLYDDAVQAVEGSGSVDEVLDGLGLRLCRRVEKAPRPALRRMLKAQRTGTDDPPTIDADRFGFQRAFLLVVQQAQDSGDLPPTVAATELAAVLEGLLFLAISAWADDEDADLLGMVRGRFALVLAGARAVAPAGLRAVRPA